MFRSASRFQCSSFESLRNRLNFFETEVRSFYSGGSGIHIFIQAVESHSERHQLLETVDTYMGVFESLEQPTSALAQS